MRLLDTSTLRLVSKRDDEDFSYAILSHTWGGDDDEVTLQDLKELTASRLRGPDRLFSHPVAQKAGYAKIYDSAKLALAQGYRYIWIDTCCIDKTSSAELSEAINSMFRWYQNSAVCYAFLSDVGHVESHDTENAVLRSSRWFTRGWTLQELIAPSDVLFYNKEWKLIGRKREDIHFQALLSDITGIEVELLNGTLGLDEFSIATRMKWASERRTTRLEDIAYCLMGIVSIQMPLLYGEGSRAFIRLQEEILKGSIPFTCIHDP